MYLWFIHLQPMWPSKWLITQIHTFFVSYLYSWMMWILRADRFSQISTSGRETDTIATQDSSTIGNLEMFGVFMSHFVDVNTGNMFKSPKGNMVKSGKSPKRTSKLHRRTRSVTYPSTNRAQCCLTLTIGRDASSLSHQCLLLELSYVLLAWALMG